MTSQQDSNPPSLLNFGLAPTGIDTGAGSAVVQATFTASDELSGVASARATLLSSGSQPQPLDCQSTLPDSCPNLTCAYHCFLVFPAHSLEGTWTVSQVEILDAARHARAYATSELVLLHLPVQVSVGFETGHPLAPVVPH